MGAPSALSPQRCYDETWEIIGTFTIGASGAHTKQYGGRGISSISRSAAGKFQINMTDVGGRILDVDVKYWQTTGTAPLMVEPTVDSFSATAKTVLFEVYDADTPALTDPPSGALATVRVRFLKSA